MTACVILIGVVGLVVSLLPGREVRTIRGAVAGAHSHPVTTKMAFGVGRFALGIARSIADFVPANPELRSALQAVRWADVSLQRLESPLAVGERTAVLAAVDRAMEAKGWERVVGVLEGDRHMGEEVIGIYAPAGFDAEEELRLALFVLEDRELITVAAEVRLDPLVELAGDRIRFEAWHDKND